MPGRLQKVAALTVAALVFAAPSFAADVSWAGVSLAAERSASAAATVRIPDGWSASLLVSYLGKRSGLDESAGLRASTFVNARLARDLSKNTRLSFDVFNVFDHRLHGVDYFSATRLSNPAGNDSYLFNPGEPRGFRLKLRTTF